MNEINFPNNPNINDIHEENGLRWVWTGITWDLVLDNLDDRYQLLSEKGQINGYASLDDGGKVPATQLPSYVDDVLEFDDLSSFPLTGETGKIYVTLDTNKIYRWSGSTYIEISSGGVTLISTENGITGGPITTSGTVGLTGQALALHNLSTNGIISRTGSGTVSSRIITGSTSISVSNGDGVSGNPTLSAIFGTTSGTVAQGNDSRFHNAVTIGTANGLSLNNQILSLALASSTTSGALSSTDWNTFNNKENILTFSTGLNRTGNTITNTITQYTDALARQAISLTTSGNSGSSTYNNTTGVLNIPTYTLAGLGYTGALNADNYNSWVLAASGVTGTQSITSGAVVTFSGTSPILVSRSTGTITYSHATSGVTAGTYNNVTVNATGHVTAGSNISYQPLDADLTAIAGLTGTTGLLRKTAPDTWTLDTNVYLTNLAHTHTISNSSGASQFVFGVGEDVRFAGNGATAVSFTPSTRTITISSTDTNTTYTGSTSIILNGTSFERAALSRDVSAAQNNNNVTVVGLRGIDLPILSPSGGLLRYTGTTTNTWAFDTNTYLTTVNLGYTASTTNGVVTNTAGNNATIPLVGVNAGLMAPTDKTKLDGLSNYTLPTATSTVLGGVRLFSDTVQTVASNAVTTTALRTYGVQLNSSGQAVVNVPWVDTNTTYTAGNGLTLTGTSFSLPVTISGTGTFVQSVAQNTNGITVTLATPPDTTYELATTTISGLVRLGVAAAAATINTASTTAGRFYPIGATADGNMYVNIPWVDTNTTYSAGNGLTSSGTVFSLGTPSSVTLTSTNNTTVSSHTHEFTPGGTTAQYITGAGTLAAFPTIPTVNNATLTLSTSGIATGSQTWTSNQSTNATFTVNVPGTNIAEGTRTTTTVPITSSTGNNATLSAATTTLAGVMTSADKTKLDGIQAGAQVNVGTNLSIGSNTATVVRVDSSTGNNVTLPLATSLLAGVLSAGDYNAFANKIGGFGSENFVVKFSAGGTTIQNSQIFDNATTVGINTTGIASATGRLQVSGGATISSLGASNNVIVGSDNIGNLVKYTIGSGLLLSGNILTATATGSSVELVTSGVTTIGAVRYAGTSRTAGQFYGGSGSNPTATTRLNYDGNLFVNELNAIGDVIAFSTSDIRLKDNLTPIGSSLEKINELGGYTFDWNNLQETYTGKDYGVAAQEVEALFPEMVITRENGYKAVKYEKLIPVLIEAIKELSKEVKELKGNK
jgi:hypothetical protein